jgi:hypothetical protein
MPIPLDFNSIAPAFDEENRRRIRPRPGPPPILPDVSRPEVAMTPPTMPPRLGAPGPYRPSRYDELNEAKGAYLEKTPGRFKSGLLGALRGFAGGGGLGGAITGGVAGAVDPRGLREQQFNQRIRPQIEDRFRFEDMERAQQAQEASAQRQGVFDQAKLAEMGADIDLKRSQAEKNRMPAPVKAPPPQYKLGRHNKTGQFRWYNAADPELASEHTPHVNQPAQPSRFVVNERGEYVDVAAEQRAGRKVKAFQRPRAPKAAPKAKAEKKYAAITDVRAYAESKGISESQAATAFKEKGYQIVR